MCTLRSAGWIFTQFSFSFFIIFPMNAIHIDLRFLGFFSFLFFRKYVFTFNIVNSQQDFCHVRSVCMVRWLKSPFICVLHSKSHVKITTGWSLFNWIAKINVIHNIFCRQFESVFLLLLFSPIVPVRQGGKLRLKKITFFLNERFEC